MKRTELPATRKAIILAGGAGTRLDPLTRLVCKQLLPIYDKPMVYYPLATLMLGGIRDILIISTPKDLPMFEHLFGDGARLGMRFAYIAQPRPAGIAQAFVLGESFVAGERVALILGDNIFHGKLDFFRRALQRTEGACIFGYQVRDPERYGVVEFASDGTVLGLEEKPTHPRSSFAVPGLYIYDGEVTSIAKNLEPSPRGEYEITDVNREYLRRGTLHVEILGRGIAWLDTGTQASLLDAGNYIAAIENRQGFKVACLEEIAYNQGFITRDQLGALAEAMPRSDYREYVRMVHAESERFALPQRSIVS
jgi:glucose-1-phosphate thymidylyltransferase